MLESMGAGVPVLCFDHQSGHDLVTPECGILLPVTDPKTAVTELAATLLDLSRHPKKLRAMSDGARRQAEKFLWSVNGDRMNAVYRECAQLPARTELQRVPG
jgi:glycosyltransferase involved in cell wall biosynthesis